MSSPAPPPSAEPVPEFYCHNCSHTTREPERNNGLQCPHCRSDFIEELEDPQDPRRLEDASAPGDEAATPGAIPSLSTFMAAMRGMTGPGQQQQQQQPHVHSFTLTSTVDPTSGRRVTRVHPGGHPATAQPAPDAAAMEQEDEPPVDDGAQPNLPPAQGLTAFLNQAFQAFPASPGAAPAQNGTQQNAQPVPPPTGFVDFVQALLGGAAPATGPDGHTHTQRIFTGPGGMQFFFNTAMGLAGNGGVQFGDALNDQGFDNFITQLMNQAMAGSSDGPRRAPEEMIRELPHKTLEQSDIESFKIAECAICKDDFQPSEQVITLPCSHVFHSDCITPWLERSGTCAVCRHELVEQPHPERGGEQQTQTHQRPEGEGQADNAPDPEEAPAIDTRQELEGLWQRLFDRQVHRGQALGEQPTAGGGPSPQAHSGQSQRQSSSSPQSQAQTRQRLHSDEPEQEPLD